MAESLLSIGLEVAAIHVLGIIAACHAVMNTRTSQGAVAWAVALVSIPYLTLIPYLFLGRSRFAGYVDEHRFNSARARARTEAEVNQSQLTVNARRDAAAEPALRRFVALDRLVGRRFLAGNEVSLLRNGAATFDAIFAAIGRAERYVLVQFFVVRDDPLGRELHRRLLERAAAGVKVYFLYDGIGSHALARRYVESLRAGGVQIHAFAIRRFSNRFQLNFRNHRKIVVVDGQTAFVGGHNVGVEYLGENPRLSPWRDTHIRLSGPVVAQVQRTFSEDWYWVTQELPDLHMPETTPGDMMCLAVPSGPADHQETGSLFMVQAIQAAQRRIWLASPYFVPDSAVQSALRLAVLRGVDVRVLVPCRPDHFTVYQASLFHTYEAVRAGVKIYRYQPGFLHQKVVLVDDDTAAVGSANLDNRSFRLNFELTVLTVSPAFAADVEAMLLADFAHAVEVKPDEWARIPLLPRVVMHVARMFAPVL
ncbi:cardiolipin synthase [Pigmentiphaga sp. NML080357]|uniref:cardiolipin synthase n=1 Tax=Pigmentiphaga sp. NML080357 TaxID=2008675 RepID=UPI000B41E863|nr:cardiolipin synthase [Pigmentiphaga sp. NML080357]OVZ55339.1 cardiolipin synthase [Pigmentiphaga sp. NML080357]